LSLTIQLHAQLLDHQILSPSSFQKQKSSLHRLLDPLAAKVMAARLQASLLGHRGGVGDAGVNYTVGAPGGSWDLRTDLADWASSIAFRTGDRLVFSYDAAAHDVVEVTGRVICCSNLLLYFLS
jgi:hypothetical protein